MRWTIRAAFLEYRLEMKMKRKRRRIKLVILFLGSLFLLLGIYGIGSISTYGTRWFSYRRNPRLPIQKAEVLPGDILDRNGAVLATCDAQGNRIYAQDAEMRKAVVHVVGDASGKVSNAVESFQTGYLYGFERPFWELASDLLSGKQGKGDTVQLTIDGTLSREIVRTFSSLPLSAGHAGAAVVMNWQTGEVLAEVSLPGFDPLLASQVQETDAGQPFWNRATQSLYPPGSIFKTVTAAAALESLENPEQQIYMCEEGVDVDGFVIHDFGNASHGQMTMQDAYLVSCNQIFAHIALAVGDTKLRACAERFGFNDNFLFRDMVVSNSTYPVKNGRSRYEVAASGFGQSAIAASPLHLCLIASAVADHGIMMEPILLHTVSSENGAVRTRLSPRVYRKALDVTEADTLKQYMLEVVRSGTGRKAACEGLTIGGKTGTADSTLRGSPISYGWFVGFCAEEACPYSVCVLVEDIDSGEGGGSTAAPIAARIFSYLRDMKSSGR